MIGNACSVIMPGNPVFMLSGQGSQKPGMGLDLMEIPEVADTFSCASAAFGFNIEKCIEQESLEVLSQTRNAQAAILALSVGLARALRARGVKPSAVLGFSLGQIGSLAVSGMLGLEETFALARVRADLMEQTARLYQGSMCALLGADEAAAHTLCDECAEGEVLVIANYNCPGQIVISGTKHAIDRAVMRWAAEKKRSAVLATAGAFHSPLMRDAADAFSSYLKSVVFQPPAIPLICNVDAQALDITKVRTRLAQHLVAPVRFEQSVAVLQTAGADTFIEVGFGGVLMGLVKRIDKGLVRDKVEDRGSFESICERFVRSEKMI